MTGSPQQPLPVLHHQSGPTGPAVGLRTGFHWLLVQYLALMTQMVFSSGVLSQTAPPYLTSAIAATDTQPNAEVSFRGIVKAVHQAALSTELIARVAKIHVREGEKFREGNTLISFDCERQRQELHSLEATAREMQVTVVSNQSLLSMGAANRNDLDISAARHDRAIADVMSMRARMTQCTFIAPFDGSVIEVGINTFEFPATNRPFMTIVGDQPLEIEIIAPSRIIDRLVVGSILRFIVDENSRSYSVRIARTSGAVDGVSQTVKIYAGFVSASAGVLPGMSGTARFGDIR